MIRNRRSFLKTLSAGAGLSAISGWHFIQDVLAAVKRKILPKGTDPGSLRSEYPAYLDTRNLNVSPLAHFQTMGETDVLINQENWRLTIQGKVKNEISVSYDEIKTFPSLTKEVLLICPGYFSQHGRWQGISMKTLFDLSGIKADAERIEFEGEPEGTMNAKKSSYSVQEALEQKVFLAYNVNGEPLPIKHGFPLRVVAEDHYGGDWVKYVRKITIK